MKYSTIEDQLQGMFQAYVPLSPAQLRRVVMLCVAVLVAGEVSLTRLARFLPQQAKQASRMRWIQRLLSAAFLSHERVYAPLLQQALKGYHAPIWHVIIDRTRLEGQPVDLVTISLNYQKRAIPLVWCLVPFGGASNRVYADLVLQAAPLIPPGQRVVFHGDTEFGCAVMMRQLRHLGWDFMLGVTSAVHIWPHGAAHSQRLGSLTLPKSGTLRLTSVDCFQKERVGALNLIAFRDKNHSGGHLRRVTCYLMTSLPLSAATKRLGRRRWGTEPYHRDYKSAGWHLNACRLTSPHRLDALLVILAVCYLSMLVLGRWLSKTGRRREIDSHRRRHLSLFRLGWDCFLHAFRLGEPIPIPLSLYP